MSRAILPRLLWTDRGFEPDRAILVEGDRIAGVVSTTDVPRDALQEDWGDVAVIPGTVNAHGHAFQSLFKGFADDRPFASWRDDVLYPFSERLTPDDVYAGALFAFAEALLAGVTTTVDFFYLHDGGNDNAGQVIRASHDVGIRLVLGRAFYDMDAPTGAPARYREDAKDAAARCRALAEQCVGDSLIAVQPAPHSLHAASLETVGVALDLARSLHSPCHIHLAEAHYEREQIERRYGATPVRLLAREGLLDERLIAIHAVWVDDDEIELLADAGVGIVHCPGANAFLGDGIALVPEMVERGIRVALGTDGGCANNRQSVFDEMRAAALVAKARLADGAALSSRTVFEMGTAAGADLLRLPVGEITAGKYADLVGLDLDDLSLQPPATIERQIVNSMQPTAIARVMVGGEVVAEDWALTKFDVAEVRARVAQATAGWSRP